jgi:hypothetical protein
VSAEILKNGACANGFKQGYFDYAVELSNKGDKQ